MSWGRQDASEAVDRALRKWPPLVATAALAFEARWTVASLHRVDPKLAARLEMQLRLWRRAVIEGTANDIETHGPAMIRGYAMCASVMAACGGDDDAYVIGRTKNGFTIAIGDQKASAARVAGLYGEGDASKIAWFTPDELAELIATKFSGIAAIKSAFPGAEITEVRSNPMICNACTPERCRCKEGE